MSSDANSSNINNNDDETGNDELVSSFMAFTSCADPSRAASYLEMSGGDLQTAVGLYMEHEQGGSDHPPRFGAASAASGAGGGRGPSSSSPTSSGGYGGGPPMMGGFDVRAPDETRTMRLMDDQMMAADPALQLMNAMMEEQLARTAFASLSDHDRNHRRFDARAAVNAAAGAGDGSDNDNEYNYDEDDDVEDGDEDDDEVQIVPPPGAAPPPAPRLTDIFAAPNHLIHKPGGFAGARATAKDSKRWLLVNIQRDAEFSSHALNRDVWRDELVENLIREGFIFWQAMDMSPDGQTFVQRYQVNDFPHISIIDPRTGRLLWRKEGWTQQNPVTASSFAEMAMDFCSRNTFDRPPQAPRPPGGALSGSSAAGAARPTQKRPVHEMTEDEQLQEAMRASIQDATGAAEVPNDITGGGGGDGDDEDDEVQVVDSPMDVSADDDDDAKPPPEKKAANSLIEELLALRVEDEPSAGSRLALRMPDGKRVVRKFAPTDKVKTVYAYIAQSNDEARGGRDFTLMAGFPPADLILDLDRSVDDCKLAGEKITVRWKDE